MHGKVQFDLSECDSSLDQSHMVIGAPGNTVHAQLPHGDVASYKYCHEQSSCNHHNETMTGAF